MIKVTPDGKLYVLHAPGAELDYGFDFSKGRDGQPPFLQEGETIVTSAWTVTEGIALSREQVAGPVTSAWASGGVRGHSYWLVNSITTSAGRKDSRTIELRCTNY